MSTWMDTPSSGTSSLMLNATSVVVNAAVNHTGSHSYEETRFNPSMAIIIVVLLGTFFFMGFLSIYVKKCVTTERDMELLQIPMSWAVDHSNSNGRSAGNQVAQMYQSSSTGLDKGSIRSLPIVGFTRSNECCVCLSEFQENECVRLLPMCGHTFHVECIDTWLSSHTTCPLCRFNLCCQEASADTGSNGGAVPPETVIEIPSNIQPDEVTTTDATTEQVHPVPPDQMDCGEGEHHHRVLPTFLFKFWFAIRFLKDRIF